MSSRRRSTHLTGRTGEFLVAAELARRGYVSTTFSGNVPNYDIVAIDDRGKHATIQVKTIRGSSWQFNLAAFCDIEVSRGRQVVKRAKRSPVVGLICVLLTLREYGSDRFFICTWRDLRNLVVAGHRRYLARHGGRRPVNPSSLHTALRVEAVEKFEGNWALIERLLR